MAGDLSPSSTTHGRERNPYPGPRALGPNDSIYGRDLEIRDLRAALISHRIVLLYSRSGAGKTSLIEAGLGPELVSRGFTVLPTIRVGYEPPRGHSDGPNRYQLSVVASLEASWRSDGPGEDRELASAGLSGFFARIERDLPDSDPIYVFDQFEELFTLNPADWGEKEAFLRDLGQALADGGRWALVSMREEFIAQLDPYLMLIPKHFGRRYRLSLLGVDAAKEAIVEPAAEAGVRFAADAAQLLVDDLRRIHVEFGEETKSELGPHVEPVQLQVVCRRIWAGLDPSASSIERKDVRESGDVDKALAEFYNDEVAGVASLPGARESAIRSWFEHELITQDGFRKQVRSGPGRAGRSVLGSLLASHLIRSDRIRGAEWYELSHDRFVEPIRRSNTDYWGKRRVRVGLAAVALLAVVAAGTLLGFALNAWADADAAAALAEAAQIEAEEALAEAAQTETEAEAAAAQTDTEAEAARLALQSASDLADSATKRAEEAQAALQSVSSAITVVPGVLSGKIVTVSNDAVAGAVVTLNGAAAPDEPLGEILSGDSGDFEFLEVPTLQELVLAVSAAGFCAVTQPVTLADGERRLDISITLEPASACAPVSILTPADAAAIQRVAEVRGAVEQSNAAVWLGVTGQNPSKVFFVGGYPIVPGPDGSWATIATVGTASDFEQEFVLRAYAYDEARSGILEGMNLDASTPVALEELPPPLASASIVVSRLPEAQSARYVNTSCGSVVDGQELLEWFVGPDVDTTWTEATTWASNLEDCGGGWTLPTEAELLALIDDTVTAGTGYVENGVAFPARIDPAFDGIGGGSWVWTAEQLSDMRALSVNMNQGEAVPLPIDQVDFPVRSLAKRSLAGTAR